MLCLEDRFYCDPANHFRNFFSFLNLSIIWKTPLENSTIRTKNEFFVCTLRSRNPLHQFQKRIIY